MLTRPMLLSRRICLSVFSHYKRSDLLVVRRDDVKDPLGYVEEMCLRNESLFSGVSGLRFRQLPTRPLPVGHGTALFLICLYNSFQPPRQDISRLCILICSEKNPYLKGRKENLQTQTVVLRLSSTINLSNVRNIIKIQVLFLTALRILPITPVLLSVGTSYVLSLCPVLP